MKPTQETLELAKQNVETYYSVVGITDDLLGDFLALLEQTSPTMLHVVTASALLWTKIPLNTARGKYIYDKPEVMAIMERRMTLENKDY